MRFNYQCVIFLLLCSMVFSDHGYSSLGQNFSEIEVLKKTIEKNLKYELEQQIPVERRKEILVFISFSMPEESIKQWLIEANVLEASLNIRGLIENSMPKTMIKIQKLIEENENQGGINIDPELFESFSIQKVPAVIVLHTEGEKRIFDIVYGTSSISEALKLFEKDSGKI